jgi:hypothetical protein
MFTSYVGETNTRGRQCSEESFEMSVSVNALPPAACQFLPEKHEDEGREVNFISLKSQAVMYVINVKSGK